MVEVKGEMLDLKVSRRCFICCLCTDARLQRTVNNMVDSLRLFAAEVTRVAKEVGIDGQLGGQAYVYVVRFSVRFPETDESFRAASMVNLPPRNSRQRSAR